MSGFKKRLSKISPLTIGVALLFAAIMTYVVFRAFAASGTATMYTSPAGTQSVSTGQTFTVSVRVSSGSSVPVTGAAVYLSYPTSKLQVLAESYGGPYNTQLVASDSGGVLRMDRAAFPMVSGGDQLFAQVTFKAIASGSAPLSFTGSSIVTSGEDDSNILAQKNGVTYNITTPATPPPASSGGSTSSGTTTGSGSRSSSGTTSSPKTSTSGGTSSGSATTSSSGSAQSPTTSSSGSAATATGSPGATDQSISSGTESAVQIAIIDSNNKPVEGALVTINGQTAKTDKNGIAHFSNIPSGNLKLAVSYNGNKTSKTVQVKGAATQASPELFKVSIKRNKFNPFVLLIPVLMLLAAGVYFIRPWGMKFAKAPAGFDTSDQVVTSAQSDSLGETPAGHKLETPGTVYSPGEAKPSQPGSIVSPAPPSETPDVQKPKDGQQPPS